MKAAKGRILCTDDNPDTRELVFAMLETTGHEVICVGSSAEALNLLKREKFDLIVMDNWMPEMTGTELTRVIRQFDKTTPILFYSAAAYEADKKAALDAGAQVYLTKPDGIDHLLDEVDKLIGEA
jgi:CheY-like chemotaxis protein